MNRMLKCNPGRLGDICEQGLPSTENFRCLSRFGGKPLQSTSSCSYNCLEGRLQAPPQCPRADAVPVGRAGQGVAAISVGVWEASLGSKECAGRVQDHSSRGFVFCVSRSAAMSCTCAKKIWQIPCFRWVQRLLQADMHHLSPASRTCFVIQASRGAFSIKGSALGAALA